MKVLLEYLRKCWGKIFPDYMKGKGAFSGEVDICVLSDLIEKMPGFLEYARFLRRV